MPKENISESEAIILRRHIDELYYMRGLLRYGRRPDDPELNDKIENVEMQLGYCPID